MQGFSKLWAFPNSGFFQTSGFSNFPGDEILNAATARAADCGLFETSFLQCLMYPKSSQPYWWCSVYLLARPPHSTALVTAVLSAQFPTGQKRQEEESCYSLTIATVRLPKPALDGACACYDVT